MTIANLNRSLGIPLRYANRHGLVTGQTGTGKSVTLMRLAEQFSQAGVPVFVSDVKTDLGALARTCPVTTLDLFGRDGAPIRLTVAAMGADLLARALELTDTQSAVLEIAFAFSGDNGFRLDTIDDLRQILNYMLQKRVAVAARYGQVTAASTGVVMRGLLRLESQGGGQFFRVPAFDIADLFRPSQISILAADRLIQSSRLYSAFLLWLLSELYERLPEVGDLDRPKLVFFFDEAHLLFDDAPAALLRRIEQTVRLIRSKGVGIYFVSQSRDDIPPVIRDQLAHQIEHSRSLAIGTARVSTLDQSGRPLQPVTARIDLPTCPLGPLTVFERPAVIQTPTSVAPTVKPMSTAAVIALMITVFGTPIALATWLIWSGYWQYVVAFAVVMFIMNPAAFLGFIVGVWYDTKRDLDEHK